MRRKKFRNFTILVAEDDPVNFIYITEVLKGTNINLLHAKNGNEAVEISDRNKSIDLILMDLRMPVLNGYEATKIIKKNTPCIPIIAVTAYSLSETEEMAKEAGCDGYYTKPIRRDTLLNIIEKVYNK